MRATITALGIPPQASANDYDKHITVSIGIATQNVGNPVEVPALIGAADRALYAAKRAGRNQVIAQPL